MGQVPKPGQLGRPKRKYQLTGEQKRKLRRMTRLRQDCIMNYLGGMNQEESYVSAGGTAKSVPENASKIFNAPEVADWLEDVLSQISNNKIMTREKAMERLSAMGNAQLSDLVEFSTIYIESSDGKQVPQSVWSFKDAKNMTRDQMSIITEVMATREGLKIKTSDPKAAIKQLAEMAGWNEPEKIDLVDSREMSSLDLARRVLMLIAEGKREEKGENQ